MGTDKNKQLRSPSKLEDAQLKNVLSEFMGAGQETSVTTLKVDGMGELKEAVKDVKKLDKAVAQLSKKLLRLPNSLDIDILYDDKKIDKKIIDRITDIKKNIDYNVGKVFDFPDSKKTIKSLRSSSGALHPLSESSSAALTSVMDSFRQSGGTNVVEMQKIISDMLQIEEHINRLGKKITKKPNDLYDINAVVSYADALKDMIRATKVWIDLQEQVKKANHGDISFANFNPNIQGMYEDFQKRFESFQEEVIRDWYGQFIKLNGKFDAKIINGIAKASNGKGKLKGIYSKNSAAIEETRSKNRVSDVAVYNEAVAKMYALGVDEALSKITDIVKSKAFKKENISKDLMKEFSGYLTAYLSGGGESGKIDKLLKDNGIAGDVGYYLSKENNYLTEDITKEIERFVEARKSAADKLRELETKTRNAGFSEHELKLFSNIASRYKDELKDETKYVEALSEAYEVLMKIRNGSEKEVRDLFTSKSKVATNIFKMLAKENKLSIRSNDEKKAALDYLVANRTSIPSNDSDAHKKNIVATNEGQKEIVQVAKEANEALEEQQQIVNRQPKSSPVVEQQKEITQETQKTNSELVNTDEILSRLIPKLRKLNADHLSGVRFGDGDNAYDLYESSWVEIDDEFLNKFIQKIPSSKKGIKDYIDKILKDGSIYELSDLMKVMSQYSNPTGNSAMSNINNLTLDRLSSKTSKQKVLHLSGFIDDYVAQWKKASEDLKLLKSEIRPVIQELAASLNVQLDDSDFMNFDKLLDYKYIDRDGGISLYEFIKNPIESFNKITQIGKNIVRSSSTSEIETANKQSRTVDTVKDVIQQEAQAVEESVDRIEAATERKYKAVTRSNVPITKAIQQEIQAYEEESEASKKAIKVAEQQAEAEREITNETKRSREMQEGAVANETKTKSTTAIEAEKQALKELDSKLYETRKIIGHKSEEFEIEKNIAKNAINSEIADLSRLISKLSEVRESIRKKSEEFEKEKTTVSQVVSAEIGELDKLIGKLKEVIQTIGRDDKIDFSALRDALEKAIKNISASPDVVIETTKVKTEIETAINNATGKPVIQIEPVEIKAEIEKGIGLVDKKANIVATVSDIVYDKKFLPDLNAETDGQLSINPKEIDANKSPLIIDNIGINKAKLGAQIEDAISSSSGTPDIKIDKAKISNDIGSAIDNTTINPSVLTENITEQLKGASASVNVRPLVDGPEFIHEVESALKDFSVKIASDIEFDLVEKQKKPKASEEATTMAKSIAKELGVANRSVISEAALEIDDLLSGVKSNVSGLFDILAKDGKAGDAVVGVLTNQYSQIMNYIKSSKIKKDPTFGPEFGDDWQNVRKTIGPGVIGRNGVDIDAFIDDLNEVFKVNVGHGINPADSLRNLFDFIDKFSVNISDTLKSQWTANGHGVKWLNSAVFGPSERKYTLAQNQPKIKPITSSTTQTQPNNSNQNPPPVSVPVNPVPVNPSAPSTPITPNNPVPVNVPINPNPAPPRKQDDVISQKGYADEDYWSKTLKLGEARTQTISTSLDEDGNQVEQALPVRIEYSKLEKLLKISAKRRFELASQIDAAVEAKNKELEDLLVEKLIRQTDLDNRLKSELDEYLKDSSYAIEAKPIKGRLNDYEQELLLDGNIKTARTRISGNDKLNSYLRTVDKNYKSIASNRTLPLDASQLSKFEAQRDAVYNLIEQIRADMKNKSRALDSSDIDMIQRSIADMNQLGKDLQEAIRLSRKNSTAKDKVERQINGFLIEIAEADAKYLDNVTKPIKEADKQSMAKKRADVESYIKSYIGRENLSPQDILDIVTRKNAYKHEAENVQRNNYSASKLAAQSTDVNVSQLKTKVSSLLLDLKESEAETDRLELKLIDLFERISDSQKSGIDTPLYKDFDEEFKLIYEEAKRVQDIYKENNKAYVDNYNTIKLLFDARSELNILEAKQAKRKPGEDYSGLIAKQKEEIEGLEAAANEAYDRIVQMSKLAGPDLNTITAEQFDRATKLFEDSKTGSFESQNSKTNAEGSRKYKEQSEAVKELESAVKNYIDTFDILVNVTKNGVDQVDWLKSFESLNDAALKMGEAMSKLRNIGYDNDSIRKIRDDIFADTNFDPKSDVGYVIDYYAKKIDDFEKKLGEVGQGASKSLNKLRNELSEIFHSFNDGYGDIDSFQALNVLNVFGNGLNDIFDDIKNVNSKELKYSKLSKSINEMLNELENSGNEVKKLPEYADKIQEFHKSINDAFKSREKYDDDGNLLPFTQSEYDDLISELEHIENRIKKFKKDVSGYDYENKKGKIVDDTIGNVSNIDDLTASLKRYAAANKYGDATSVKTAASGDKVTMKFKDQDGAIRTLVGSWDKLTNSMRVTESVQKSMMGGGFFGRELEEIGRYVTMTMDVGDVIMWVRGQFSKAIETFKAYDASLTNVSYTMDLTREGLYDLGSDALDMAEDLALSVENAMGIYEIYANMNTTAQEIKDVATPTAILANISGNDTDTTSDQIQGVLQQFNMLEDEANNVADASMHVVDVLADISANVAIDNVKAIGIMSDAVQAAGAEAYQAGLSFEQLAAISAKVSERTRDDGSSIGNALKTIIVRLSKVGKMPGYADEVSNEELSNASKSLNEIGIQVYESNGEFRQLDVILGELSAKWDTLTDAQKANISYNVAA